jgi:hypothetical protein
MGQFESTQELHEILDSKKFVHWKEIVDAVRDLVRPEVGIRLYEIPSRSMFLRKATFPASRVTAEMSLDGRTIVLAWDVRERIGGLIQSAMDAFEVTISSSGDLCFKRKNENYTVGELSRLMVALAERF